jgi:hypothetical protein
MGERPAGPIPHQAATCAFPRAAPLVTFLRNLWTLWKRQVPRASRLWITSVEPLSPSEPGASIMPARTCHPALKYVEKPLFAGMIPRGARLPGAVLEFSTSCRVGGGGRSPLRSQAAVDPSSARTGSTRATAPAGRAHSSAAERRNAFWNARRVFGDLIHTCGKGCGQAEKPLVRPSVVEVQVRTGADGYGLEQGGDESPLGGRAVENRVDHVEVSTLGGR